jgi:hypothetical protein
MIPFTRRELTNAWKCARSASKVVVITNAHRLLMFYAVECGLKAVHLRLLNRDVIDEKTAREHSHDLNGLLTSVRAGKEYFFPNNFSLKSITLEGKDTPRKFNVGSLNQVWRYGGILADDENTKLEVLLEKIDAWIAKEIR